MTLEDEWYNNTPEGINRRRRLANAQTMIEEDQRSHSMREYNNYMKELKKKEIERKEMEERMKEMAIKRQEEEKKRREVSAILIIAYIFIWFHS